MFIPKKIFLTKGVGKAPEYLTSFEMALRDAGIGQFNIVEVSSIIPPGCEIIPKEKGLELLKPGQIIFCVLAKNSTNEPNRLIAASVGLAIPADPNIHGYLSEHASFGETDEKAGKRAEDLAATMLATLLGLEFDVKKDFDERKREYLLSGKIVKTRSITQSAEGDKNGLWTTVVAAAVLLD
jgi:arginine decarboxylase